MIMRRLAPLLCQTNSYLTYSQTNMDYLMASGGKAFNTTFNNISVISWRSVLLLLVLLLLQF